MSARELQDLGIDRGRYPQRCPRSHRSLSGRLDLASSTCSTPAHDAGVFASVPPRRWRPGFDFSASFCACISRIAALQHKAYQRQRESSMIYFIEAMHLLPQSFDSSDGPLLLPRGVCGTAALLLPAAVRFFSESLPHLLPRQAFSFWPKKIPARAKAAACDHRLMMASSSPQILLSIPRFSFVLLRALRLLKRAPTNLLTPNLSYNYVTGWIPPQRNRPDKTGFRNSDDPWRQ